MDRDLLRIVIISVGGLVVLGLILWSIFSDRRSKRNIDFYDKGNPLDNIDSSLMVNTDNDDFDIVPLGSALADDADVETEGDNTESARQSESTFEVPKIIQFSIIAPADQLFNGQDLSDAFDMVGLQYGSMKVFERPDEQNRVDYAVASMVEPGTFPEADLELYDFPGIVFFLQPEELDEPLVIFDELIETLGLLTTRLGGEVWDHNRILLTNETVQLFRKHLN